MTKDYEALDLKNLKPHFLYSYKNKISVLCVYEENQYKRLSAIKPYLGDFSFEYVNHNDFLKFKNFSNYDLIWSFGSHLFKEKNETIDFVKRQNKNKIFVCGTFFDDLPEDYLYYNSVSTNNPDFYGDDVFRTNDGIDLLTYGHDRLVERRGLKVLFFEECELKNKLEDMHVECCVFEDKSPTECNSLFNECSLFIDLDGRMNYRILELSACGVVGITNNKGYYRYIKNKVVYNSDEEIFGIISSFDNNIKNLHNTSKRLTKEMLNWDIKNNYWMYVYFLQNCIKSKKCLLFV